MIVHRWADDLTIYEGDVRQTLANLPDESVQTCVTSPPYWGLRDYGTAEWEGGNPDCDHKPSDTPAERGIASSTLGGGKESTGHRQEGFKTECPRCGARRIDSQLGLEPTIEEYVANMVEVFREVRRVLRKDGTLWLNLGDSYNGSGGAGGDYGEGGLKEGQPKYPGRNVSGLKAKDLCGIPWRVAFALQADGWWLRSDIIWAKPNPMPESVTDRPTKAHEYIFLLTKSPTYYYDCDAIREPSTGQNLHDITGGRYSPPGQTAHTGSRPPASATFKREGSKRDQVIPGQTVGTHRPDREDTWPNGSRNKRTVWTVATQPTPEAHFATYPTKLIEPCILAGTSPQACPKCSSPWARVVEKILVPDGKSSKRGPQRDHFDHREEFGKVHGSYAVDTIGWQPTCTCPDNDGSGKCLVLDPFHGSGTTGLVALESGRAYVGCELNPEYIEISQRRLQKGQTRLSL